MTDQTPSHEELLQEVERLRQRLSELAPHGGNANLAGQDLYRAMFEHNMAMTLLIGPDSGAILDANPAACEFYGYSREELVNDISIFDLNILPKRVVRAKLTEGARRGDASFVYSHRLADGEIRQVEMHSSLLAMDQGRFLLCILHDVTERNHALEALERSELKFRLVADFTYNFEFWLTPQWRFEYASPSCARILGRSPDEFLDDPKLLWRMVHKEDLAVLRACLANAMDTGRSGQCDFRMIPAGDRMIWASLAYRPVSDFEHGELGIRCSLQDITHIKRAEQAQHEAEERLRFLISESSAVIFSMHASSPDTLSYISDNALQVFNIPAYEFMRKPSLFFDQLDPDSLSRFTLTLETIQETGHAQLELKILTREQPNLWLAASMRLVSAGEDSPGEIIGSLTDITARKEAETALQQARLELEDRVRKRTSELRQTVEMLHQEIKERQKTEEMLRSSQDRLNEAQTMANMGSFRRNLLTGEAHWSDGLYRLLGYEPQSVSPEQELLFDHIHPRDRDRVRSGFEKAIGGCSDLSLELRFLTRDGDLRFGLGRCDIICDENGTAVDIRGVVQDITESRAAEAERMRLATAIEQTGESIEVTDTDGVLQYVNPAFERITGYSREEVLGKPTSLHKSGKHSSQFYSSLWSTISSGRIWRGHLVNKRKDGTLREVEATISPIRNTTGEIISYVAVKRDVTDRLKLERQLRQSRKMEAIGTLAGGIAHDFNNILAAIMGFSEIALLKADPENELVRRNLENILKGSRRGADLVKQILTFSRHGEQEQKPLDPTPVFKESLKLLTATLPSTISIRDSFIDKRVKILGDPSQLQQLLMNLCTNSAHAIGKTKGRISVFSWIPDETEALSPEGTPLGPCYALRVEDTGHGMDPSTLERIFDPFFTTKNPGEGTGMGMAIVHGIVKSHGAAISVQSEPGRGTVIEVLFPLIHEDRQAVQLEDVPLIMGKARILFVDDDADLIESMQQMLDAMGYNVITMNNGADALSLILSTPEAFDMVIADHTMPGMTGLELASKLHARDIHLPFLLITGRKQGIDETEAASVGVREVLEKPVSLNTLSLRIHAALSGDA